MKTTFSRRHLLSGGVVAGVATLFPSLMLVGCGDEAGVTLPIPRDAAALLRTLTLDGAYLIVDPRTGRAYRIDQSANTVSQLNASGAPQWTFGASGDEAQRLNFPTGVLPVADGTVLVSDSGNGRLVLVSAEGRFVRSIDGAGSGRNAVIDSNNVLWASDSKTGTIKSFDLNGTARRGVSLSMGSEAMPKAPRGLALDAAGNLHVVDALDANVKVLTRTGTLVRQYGALGAAQGQFLAPRSIAVTPNGVSYVSDPTAGKIEVFDPNGVALARLDNLTLAGRAAVPLDVSVRNNGLVQVRLYAPVLAA